MQGVRRSKSGSTGTLLRRYPPAGHSTQGAQANFLAKS
jgi:hypothetical protein